MTLFLQKLVLVMAGLPGLHVAAVDGAPPSKQAAGAPSTTTSAHKELAKRFAHSGALSDAIREYEAVLQSNPHDLDSRLHLAELFAWTGDYDRSLVTYEDVLRSAPKNLAARIAMAQVLRWSHRYAESEQQLQDVLKADPQNLDAIKGIAQTYALAGDFARSLAFLDRGVSRLPRDAELLAQKGTVLSWSGNVPEGIDCLKKALTLDPSSASAYRSLGDAYAWRREYASAAENYRKALDRDPNSTETALDLARAYEKAGSRTLAEQVLTQVLRSNPTHHQALLLLQEIRRDARMQTSRAMDTLGEPIAFVAILSIPTWVVYRRHRRSFWQTPLYRKLYPIVFPTLSVLFLAAYALRIVFETNASYKIAEIVLLIVISILALPLFREKNRPKRASKAASVLVIGAHPDDIELGAAGMSLKLSHAGAKVYGLVLTQGEVGSPAPIGTRNNEAYEAASHLGLTDLWVLDFPDTQLRQNVGQMRAVIEEKIKQFGVELVITHGPHETHGDHTAVFEATRESARSCSMLCFESISAPKEFVPNYFVDITQYLHEKLLAIGSHKTQRRKFYMDLELVKGRAAHRGLQAGVPYAEAFWIYRWVQ